MGKICDCIEPLIIAIASAEAMEHNAIMGREIVDIGSKVKHLISQDKYDELVSEHSWLEYPIIETMAELSFLIATREIEEKCGIEVKKIRELFKKAVEENREKKFDSAQQGFIQVKRMLRDIAIKLCK